MDPKRWSAKYGTLYHKDIDENVSRAVEHVVVAGQIGADGHMITPPFRGIPMGDTADPQASTGGATTNISWSPRNPGDEIEVLHVSILHGDTAARSCTLQYLGDYNAGRQHGYTPAVVRLSGPFNVTNGVLTSMYPTALATGSPSTGRLIMNHNCILDAVVTGLVNLKTLNMYIAFLLL